MYVYIAQLVARQPKLFVPEHYEGLAKGNH